jgi:hypothetical protein
LVFALEKKGKENKEPKKGTKFIYLKKNSLKKVIYFMNFMCLLSHRYGGFDLDPRRKEKENKNPKEKSNFFSFYALSKCTLDPNCLVI